jgi:hypothetical protein
MEVRRAIFDGAPAERVPHRRDVRGVEFFDTIRPARQGADELAKPFLNGLTSIQANAWVVSQ